MFFFKNFKVQTFIKQIFFKMLHFELFLALSAIFCVVSALTLKSNLYFGTRSRKPRTIQVML